jgi:hypothetical protein
MADRRRSPESDSGAFRRDDRLDLSAELRREARAERPSFSPAVHADVLAALAARAAKRDTRPPAPTAAVVDEPAGSRQRFAWAVVGGGLAAAAACLAIAVAAVRPRPAPPPTAVAAAGDTGIERLPTPEEIGASVFAQVTTFAALAVGIPELPDLAAVAPELLAGTDDPRP